MASCHLLGLFYTKIYIVRHGYNLARISLEPFPINIGRLMSHKFGLYDIDEKIKKLSQVPCTINRIKTTGENPSGVFHIFVNVLVTLSSSSI